MSKHMGYTPQGYYRPGMHRVPNGLLNDSENAPSSHVEFYRNISAKSEKHMEELDRDNIINKFCRRIFPTQKKTVEKKVK